MIAAFSTSRRGISTPQGPETSPLHPAAMAKHLQTVVRLLERAKQFHPPFRQLHFARITFRKLEAICKSIRECNLCRTTMISSVSIAYTRLAPDGMPITRISPDRNQFPPRRLPDAPCVNGVRVCVKSLLVPDHVAEISKGVHDLMSLG
jgi:hypothetical protein